MPDVRSIKIIYVPESINFGRYLENRVRLAASSTCPWQSWCFYDHLGQPHVLIWVFKAFGLLWIFLPSMSNIEVNRTNLKISVFLGFIHFLLLQDNLSIILTIYLFYYLLLLGSNLCIPFVLQSLIIHLTLVSSWSRRLIFFLLHNRNFHCISSNFAIVCLFFYVFSIWN